MHDSNVQALAGTRTNASNVPASTSYHAQDTSDALPNASGATVSDTPAKQILSEASPPLLDAVAADTDSVSTSGKTQVVTPASASGPGVTTRQSSQKPVAVAPNQTGVIDIAAGSTGKTVSLVSGASDAAVSSTAPMPNQDSAGSESKSASRDTSQDDRVATQNDQTSAQADPAAAQKPVTAPTVTQPANPAPQVLNVAVAANTGVTASNAIVDQSNIGASSFLFHRTRALSQISPLWRVQSLQNPHLARRRSTSASIRRNWATWTFT